MEEEVRAQLERELQGTFAETTWLRVKRRDALREFQEKRLSWTDLRDIAEEELEDQRGLFEEFQREQGVGLGPAGHGGEKRRQEREEHIPLQAESVRAQFQQPILSPEETLRAEVFEEYLATVAAIHSGVRRFRRDVLGDRLLTQEQAIAFIRSPAAQAFEFGLFQSWKIPLSEHSATLDEYERDVVEAGISRDRATISVEPPGITKSVWSPVAKTKRFEVLSFVNENGRASECRVWRNSVLGRLSRIARKLSKHFPWQEAQATMLVLTGEPPAVPPMRIRYRLEEDNIEEQKHYKHGVVTLEVAAWVSEKAVSRAYLDIQKRVLGGRDNRRLSTKRLRVLRFVTQRVDDTELSHGQRRKLGTRLVEEWDRENPHWAYGRYKQPTSLFWKDYNEVKELVAKPSHRLPHEVRQARR